MFSALPATRVITTPALVVGTQSGTFLTVNAGELVRVSDFSVIFTSSVPTTTVIHGVLSDGGATTGDIRFAIGGNQRVDRAVFNPPGIAFYSTITWTIVSTVAGGTAQIEVHYYLDIV